MKLLGKIIWSSDNKERSIVLTAEAKRRIETETERETRKERGINENDTGER